MASVQVMDYNELLQYWQSMNGQVSDQMINDWITTANTYNVSDMTAIEDLVSSGGGGSVPLQFTKTADGLYNVSGIKVTAQNTINSGLPNSNVATTTRTDVTTMLNRGSENGKIKMSKTPASGSFGQNAAYYMASVGQAVTAASVGISLGKMIDSALYNANPDYWDSIGMSSLNPETWNSITAGDDSFAAGLFNFVFGLDPDTGNAQAYMDANALAYMAMVLNENGWFGQGGAAVESVPAGLGLPAKYIPTELAPTWCNDAYPTGYVRQDRRIYNNSTAVWKSGTAAATIFVNTSNSSAVMGTVIRTNKNTGEVISTGNLVQNNFSKSYTYDGRTVYYEYVNQTGQLSGYDIANVNTVSYPSTTSDREKLAWAILYSATVHELVDGVSNQTGATMPDTTDWSTIPSTLASLQQQYPNMFNNALVWDNVQPDGSNPQLTYVPVPWPDITNYNDSQPTGTTATQTQPQINQNTQTLIDTLMKTIQQTQTQTDTDTNIPPQNPIDTGTGDSPTPIAPTGSASALWSVYHPTQGEVNSFGAWLWGSPFLTNIGKLFQNPIDGVISLHKIFATPVDAGTGNIVVGTLDSGVSSATVTQQYVYVDCGDVNLNEDFANVFDYPPHTQVSLYLPFIGIVTLDTNDVMRSSINVTYGVDVFTGACLAIVTVTRDGHTAALYQYSGVCSVEYPLSNIHNGQLLTGLLGVASGAAAIGLSGGLSLASAPAILGTSAMAAGASKQHVGRSGGFSGNAGAMGCKVPYLIIQRPQTRVASTFPELAGYPTNKSGKLSSFSGQVNVVHVHVENIAATNDELTQIENLLKSGVLI